MALSRFGCDGNLEGRVLNTAWAKKWMLRHGNVAFRAVPKAKSYGYAARQREALGLKRRGASLRRRTP